MTGSTTKLAFAAGLALFAPTAHAATLDLATQAPAITGAGDLLYVPGSDLSFIGTSAGGLDISAAVAIGPTGALDPDAAPGALLVEGALSARIAALGFEIDVGTDGGDTIELLLDIDGGDMAAAFGGQALAVIMGEFGADDAFASADVFAPGEIEISALADVAPIPLPAGGLLLVSSLALIGLRRRVRA